MVGRVLLRPEPVDKPEHLHLSISRKLSNQWGTPHYPKLLETQRCIENGLSRFLKCIDCDDFDGEYPKELQDLIHEPVEEPRVHPPVHLTTPEPDIGYALTSLLIVGGIAVIIFDVATFPSGEGMIGIAMITKAIYH